MRVLTRKKTWKFKHFFLSGNTTIIIYLILYLLVINVQKCINSISLKCLSCLLWCNRLPTKTPSSFPSSGKVMRNLLFCLKSARKFKLNVEACNVRAVVSIILKVFQNSVLFFSSIFCNPFLLGFYKLKVPISNTKFTSKYGVSDQNVRWSQWSRRFSTCKLCSV